MERNQAGDVGLRVGGEYEAHGRDVARCEAAPSQDDVDESATNTTVAVSEGVDGLELRVSDRSLDNRRGVAPIHERDEVVHEVLDALGWGRDEVGPPRVVGVSPDQFCRSRNTPAVCGVAVASMSARWISHVRVAGVERAVRRGEPLPDVVPNGGDPLGDAGLPGLLEYRVDSGLGVVEDVDREPARCEEEGVPTLSTAELEEPADPRGLELGKAPPGCLARSTPEHLRAALEHPFPVLWLRVERLLSVPRDIPVLGRHAIQMR